ncbi:unnamed protein product [Caenorhabditis bovis]|uniref:Uncharacterized protein n=1 Tax=Caenorhabditis bovis TaxID=2654633 RepID=A0A8S1E7C8_9PELO|nr:unnamed protein product [Caenorhabditis bovis]
MYFFMLFLIIIFGSLCHFFDVLLPSIAFFLMIMLLLGPTFDYLIPAMFENHVHLAMCAIVFSLATYILIVLYHTVKREFHQRRNQHSSDDEQFDGDPLY